MEKEVDLSKTGYFDYLIKNGRVEDPGVIVEATKYGVEDFTPEVLERMRLAFIYEYFPDTMKGEIK